MNKRKCTCVMDKPAKILFGMNFYSTICFFFLFSVFIWCPKKNSGRTWCRTLGDKLYEWNCKRRSKKSHNDILIFGCSNVKLLIRLTLFLIKSYKYKCAELTRNPTEHLKFSAQYAENGKSKWRASTKKKKTKVSGSPA